MKKINIKKMAYMLSGTIKILCHMINIGNSHKLIGYYLKLLAMKEFLYVFICVLSYNHKKSIPIKDRTHILSGFPAEPELTTTVDSMLDPDVVKEIKEYYKVGNKVFIASSSLF